MEILSVFIGIGVLVLGLAVGYFIPFKKMKEMEKLRQGKVDEIIEKAKAKAKDIQYRTRQELKQTLRGERENLQEEFAKKERKLEDIERGASKRNNDLRRREERATSEEQGIQGLKEQVEKERLSVIKEREQYEIKRNEIVDQLERISQLSRNEAKEKLMEEMLEQAKVEASRASLRIEQEAREDAEKKAKRLIGISVQRFAGEYVAEQTISSVELPSDDIKGRLIGREGRNIRAFEQICGVDLIIDDTPGTVVLSSFNVVRREIARMTIEKLIDDGRIHQARIEEFYEKSKRSFESRLRELGERAQMEIGVHGIHPEILKLVGALNYRTSYTQKPVPTRPRSLIFVWGYGR